MTKKRIWLLTGEPATGKSTALSKILFEVKSAGFTVGGVLTREVRSHGEREGFRLVDIASEESEILAQTKGIVGPRIGKYRVNLNSLSNLAAKALEYARISSDLVACDEVGPMELLSPEFRNAVRLSVIETKKPSICVVHKRFEDPLIEELRALDESVEAEVTYENRESLPLELAKDIIRLLSTSESGDAEI